MAPGVVDRMTLLQITKERVEQMAGWSDVIARVAGLKTRLLSADQLRAMARSRDLAGLADGLEQAGFPVRVTVMGTSPAALDLAVRRQAGTAFRVLGRWCGSRADELAVIFEDEDRRSLRILLRGLFQGVAPATRLSGLIPTPSLPERALEELAAQQNARDLAGLLTIWGSPFGEPLLQELGPAQPDLFRVELQLDRTWATRAQRAGVSRDRAMRDFARTSIDFINVRSALLLALQGTDVDVDDMFLSGGGCLRAHQFRLAALAGGVEATLEVLARGMAASSFADVLRMHGDLSTLEEALLVEHISHFGRLARREPTSLAPVLTYVLRLRKQVIDLRRLVWGIALDVPRPSLLRDVVGVGS